ncbi:MAG: nucleotidyltransferase domain-containing protein [bacterium]|nr:nucleotidyltransferase domain-containing protein [bacterium]
MDSRFKYLTDIEQNAVDWLVKQLKQQLPDQLLQMNFFGSKLRGDFQPDSDIDLLIVVKQRSEKILDQIAQLLLEAELKFDPKISVIIFSEHEFQQNQAWETPFIKNIQYESVRL